MTNPRISVIVPVYNAERYLRRCVDSILAQTFTDFELLLVDDGSTDSSGAICDEYAALDTRVRTFHKPNGGVSSARNLGLDNARGEWITFVDSDDFVQAQFLEALTNGFFEDLSIGSVEIPLIVESYTLEDERNFVVKDRFDDILLIRETYLRTIWSKLYKKDIIINNLIRFPEDIRWGEDTIFMLKYLMHIESIKFSSYVGYHYSFQTGGLTSVKQDNDSLLLINRLFQTIYNSDWNIKIKDKIFKRIAYCQFREIKSYILKLKNTKEISKSIDLANNNIGFRHFIELLTQEDGEKNNLFSFCINCKNKWLAALTIKTINRFIGL